MSGKVDVKSRKLLLEGFLAVEEAWVSYEKFDGTMSPPVCRFTLLRGEAVAVVLFNRARRRVVLVNQFRLPTLVAGTGWTTELVAGVVDASETADSTARREVLEEAGYEIGTLERITTIFPSPGITTERVHLFYAETRGGAPVAEGGGLAHESEDIAVVELEPEEALARVARGDIADAKTIIGLMWLREKLRREA